MATRQDGGMASTPSGRLRSWPFLTVGCGLLLAAVLVLAAAEPPLATPVAPSAGASAAATRGVHPTIYRTPAGAPRVATGEVDHQGRPVTIACSTCHAVRAANPANRGSGDLDLFHQGLLLQHGSTTCLSCHNQGDYDRLRLADGRAVEFTEVMTLCAQCHGPQWRDYQRGVHGGMSGHWDQSRGGRVRNTCTSCHDPHSPKYRGAIPMPPPRDRFAGPGAGHE